jgi:general secretion pathway protein K
MEILYSSRNRGQSVVLEGRAAWKADGTPHRIEMAGGRCSVRIIDESGKISLNALTDSSGIILKNLLLRHGATPEQADGIVDSILDWKDPDDLHRLSGAESEYYQSLPKPYRPRNADFETLEELILVKGITPDILYGTERADGIIRHLTAQGKAARINLSAASKEVLLSLPGMDPEMATQLIAFRSSATINGIADLQEILGAGYARMAPYVDARAQGTSTIYAIESTGMRPGGEKGYSIVATVAIEGRDPYRYLYYKSPADLSP